jgi:hypothetical protein
LGAKSLKKLGELVKCEKLDIFTTSQADFDVYNIRDCEIVLKTVLLLNDLGIQHHNMPSFVRGRYSEAFIKKGWESIHSSKSWHKFEGFGARCEGYKSDISGMAYVDANSLYPTVMSKCQYPKLIEKQYGDKKIAVSDLRKIPTKSLAGRRFLENIKKVYTECLFNDRVKNYHEIFGDKLHIAKVKLIECHDSHLLHIFPFGYKDDAGMTLFRYNEDQVYEVFGYEILDLKAFDFELIELWVCDSEPLIFADMIDEMYSTRKAYKKDKNTLEYLYKIQLNAGFGIWGARGDKSRRDNSLKTRELYTREANFAANLGIKLKDVIYYDQQYNADIRIRKLGTKFYTVADDLPRFVSQSIPAIAQFTLSHSRALMFSVMRFLGVRSVEIGYTDTDSIIMSPEGLKMLEDEGMIGSNMGQFKLEYMIEKGSVLASKLYAFVSDSGKSFVVSKGVKSVSKINRSYQTSAADDLKIVNRVVTKHGTRTKRQLENGTFKNEYGVKNSEFYKTLLSISAIERNANPDVIYSDSLYNEWLELAETLE